MKVRLITLLLALAAAGCSTTPISMQSGTPVPAERIYQPELTVPSPGRTARVSFLRDAGFVGAACTHKILVDGNTVFAIRYGEFQTLHLAPGQHSFALKIDEGVCGAFSTSLSSVLADGAEETYRIFTAVHNSPYLGLPGGQIDRPRMEVISRTTGGPIALVHADTGMRAVCASPKSSQEATALLQGLPQPLVYTAYMALLADLNTRRISVVEYCAQRYELANYVRSSTPLEPAKGATYTDKTFRWSVTYPDFWQLDGSEPRAMTLKRGLAVVGIYSKNTDGESLDEVADAALRRWEQNFKKEFEIISRRRLTLSNSLPAIEVVHHVGRGVVGKSRKIYAVIKDRAFHIDTETYLEAWPMFESDFNRIVESFLVRD